MAWRPATPAPMMKALAGAIVPAAVVSIGKNLGSAAAARSTALYPATVACEESASIGCARVMRGIASIESAVTRRRASSRTRAWFVSGCRNAMSTAPSRIRPSSSSEGLATLRTRSQEKASPMVAPASVYMRSGKLDASPAPRSTMRSFPLFVRRPTVSGTRATRRSPGMVSRTTPILMEREKPSGKRLRASPRESSADAAVPRWRAARWTRRRTARQTAR